jgi:hypothetical protein
MRRMTYSQGWERAGGIKGALTDRWPRRQPTDGRDGALSARRGRDLLGSTVGFCWDRPSVLAGINRRLLLGSTIGSFADQPSARSPVTESTIEQTNTRDVGVRRSSAGDEHLREDHEAMELESWFALRTTEQLFCFLALLFKGKIQEVAVDPAAMRGVPARRAPPLHYLHEHAWRRGPATPKDSPSHRTCTGDPPKQEKITSERARIIQHFSP